MDPDAILSSVRTASPVASAVLSLKCCWCGVRWSLRKWCYSSYSFSVDISCWGDCLGDNKRRSAANSFWSCCGIASRSLTISLQSPRIRFAIASSSLFDGLSQALRSYCPIVLQSYCNRIAIVLQSYCNRIAIVLQSLCSRFKIASQSLTSFLQSFRYPSAIASLSLCNRSTITLQSFAITLKSLWNRISTVL
jgi:hypothetical protein